MNNKLKRLDDLINLANKYAYHYYTLGESLISDTAYDGIVDEIEQLEKETGVILSNSPTQKVGGEVLPFLNKVTFDKPLLSLDKTKDIEEFYNFTQDKDGVLMLKEDGLTIDLTYENGVLVQGTTRGNGEIGEDVTHNVKTFIGVPLTVPIKRRFQVTGEAIVLDEDFNKINKELIKNGEEPFKLQRALASGSVRQLDSSICKKRNIHFRAYNLFGFDELKTKLEHLSKLKELNFSVVYHHCTSPSSLTIDEFESIVEHFREYAKEQGEPIDGLVMTYNDVEYGKSLGKTSHHYNHSIAFKFLDDAYTTTLLDVQYQVGRTGKITPVAIVEPVEIDGSTITKASVHNLNKLTELQLQKGDTISIIKANQIIPQIIDNLSIDSHKNNLNTFSLIEHCPVCGKETKIISTDNSSYEVCDNPFCKGQLLFRLTHFASRDCMNIKGLSEKTMEQFIDKGIITSLEDIYSLEYHKDKILKLPKFGQKKYDNLIQAVEKSKHVKLSNFITALGIPNVGKSTAISLAKTFKTFDNLMKASFKDITDIKDIGDETGNAIYNFFRDEDNLNILKALAYDITIEQEEEKEVLNLDNPFSGKKVYATGTFENDYKKSEIKELIEYMGGTFKYSKSSLDYLIVGNKKGSSKVNEASKNGTIILTENEFIQILKDCGLGK